MYVRILALAERIGSMHGRILACHALTPLLIDTGRAAEALAVAKENVDIAEDVDNTHLKDSADVSHAQALVATGRSDEAEPLLHKLIAAGGGERACYPA